MMILRFMQAIEVEPTHDTGRGPVPIVGETTTITRAWFQCDRCGMIGCVEQLASPMMPPPCAQGCDIEPIT